VSAATRPAQKHSDRAITTPTYCDSSYRKTREHIQDRINRMPSTKITGNAM
jgi:hypothetical protein